MGLKALSSALRPVRPWKRRDGTYFAHVFSFRERKRVDTALHSASEQVRTLSAAGYPLRSDDFWEARGGFPPPAQEVLEAVLLAAKRDPEERKAIHMGQMFAHIAFDPGFSASAAHWSVRTAERALLVTVPAAGGRREG